MPNPQYHPDKPSLVGSRLKLARAKEHLDDLEPVTRLGRAGLTDSQRAGTTRIDDMLLGVDPEYATTIKSLQP